MLRAGILLLALTLAGLPAGVRADAVPPHLAGMAAQLLRANKERLKTADSEPVKRAYKALRSRSMQYWSRRNPKLSGASDAYLGAMGIDDPTAADRKAILNLHRSGGSGDDIVAFHEATGRPPPDAKILRGQVESVAKAREGILGTLANSHTMETDDGERIDLDWKPEAEKMDITVSKGGDDAYETKLSGKTEALVNDDGEIEYGAEPDADAPIEAKDKEDLDKDVDQMLGEWTDGSRTWVVSKAGNGLSLARQRGGDPGDAAVFSADLIGTRVISKRRSYDDVRDMRAGLPDEIKAKLLGNPQASEWLELVLSVEEGEFVLDGEHWKKKVTYYPDDMVISSIHSPYPTPITLRRAREEEKVALGAAEEAMP